MNEFYTKLFVGIDITLQALLQLVADECNGNLDMMTVTSGQFEIDVLENGDASIITDPSDFLSFGYTLEIVNIKDVSLDEYLEFTGDVMKKINCHGAKVIAACDWEDKLPGNGKLS